MAQYEIEIKSLLGEQKHADSLREKMRALDPTCVCVHTNKQLNHYFIGGDVQKLSTQTAPLFTDEVQQKFETIITNGTSFSVRTRQKDDAVLLVVKASLGSDTSANGVSRLEFEEPVSISLSELDALVLSAGFEYEAKWSREREEYAYKGITVCLDKNAGYGYLAEFEKVLSDTALVESARAELDERMAELEVSELPQDRLERMFAHYNAHWPEYYGTEKTFLIE